MYCARCKKESPDEGQFCIDCGGPLARGAPVDAARDAPKTPFYVAGGIASCAVILFLLGLFIFILVLKPSFEARACFNRGVQYEMKHEYDRALTEFNRAIELKPDSTEFYLRRGEVYHKKGEFEKAYLDLTKVIKLKPGYTTFYKRGVVLVSYGDYSRAIEDFSTAISMNGNYTEAYCYRGIALRKKGSYDKAIEDLDKAIGLNNADTFAYNNRGITHLCKGENDKALADLNKTLELNPEFAEAYYYRGVAHAVKRDYIRALNDFANATRLEPGFAETYYSRGMVYIKTAEYKKARNDLRHFLKLAGKKEEHEERIKETVRIMKGLENLHL